MFFQVKDLYPPKIFSASGFTEAKGMMGYVFQITDPYPPQTLAQNKKHGPIVFLASVKIDSNYILGG